MANRYWIGNGGNWSDIAHWSTVSGGTGGASVPTSVDSVYFNASSFSLSGQIVTLNANGNCLDFDWTGVSNMPKFYAVANTLNIYGNFLLSSGMTFITNGTCIINLATTASMNIDTKGIHIEVGANGAGMFLIGSGTYNLQNDLICDGNPAFRINSGTLNTNSYNLFVNQLSFNGGTVNCGNSIITSIILYIAALCNFNCGTSTLKNKSSYASYSWQIMNKTVYDIEYYTNLQATSSNLFFVSGICNNLTFNANGVGSCVSFSNNYTINGNFTINGILLSRIYTNSSIIGTQRTITVDPAKVFALNADFQDIKFSNVVDLSNIAGGSQDFGNNTNIVFTSGIDCYYKGTTGAHNWSALTNWKLPDRVSAARIPLIQDNVLFDNQSFIGSVTLNLDIAATCKNIDFTGIDKALTLSSAVNSIKIYGNITLWPNLTWTFTGTAYTYMSGRIACNITANGVIPTMNRLYMDGINGVYTNTDTLNIGASTVYLNNVTTTFSLGAGINSLNGSLWLQAGVFNTNNYNIVLNNIRYEGTSTRVTNLGSSTITVVYWRSYVLGIDTFNAGTSTIIATNEITCANPFTYFNLYLSGSGTIIPFISLYVNIVVQNVLIVNGTNSSTLKALVYSNTIGTQRNITAASVIASNVDFRDIKGLGTADWNLSAIQGNSGDCGGNSNIVFTPSQTQYYKHTSGACNWSDAKWYDVTRTTLGRVPLPQDDAVFDSLSFTGTSTLTINVVRICRTLNMSNCPSITVNWNGDGNIECYGSLLLNRSVNWLTSYSNTGHNLSFFGRGSFYFDAQNRIFNCLNFDGSNITLLSGFSIVNYMYLRSGVVDFNDNDATIPYLIVLSGTCYLGNGVITISSTGYLYGLNYYGGTLYSEGSTILISPAINYGIIQINIPASRQLNIVKIVGGVSVPSVNFIQGVSINELIIDPGKTVKFTAGTTTTIRKLTAIGTQANPITIGSVTAATHNLIKIGTDIAEVEYCNISNSHATPTNMWSAGDTSTDAGGNTGWDFNFIPIVTWH